LEKQLQSGAYKGIGEIHIFAKDKENTNYKKILQLAYEHGLPVLLHGDRAVVKQAFNWFPGLVIIWAHLGEDPDTVILEQMLMQYPSLYIDTSIRDVLIVKEGKLLEDWKHLFIKYPDRFMVAIDTYYTPRWDKMSDVTRFIRTWLKDLPNEVARKMAFDNAARLFLKH
jgi:predicted TIM-barrel fold metal-dependent hydrolase